MRVAISLVRLAGFEPARFPRQILSLLCMPIPPQSHRYYFTRKSAFVNRQSERIAPIAPPARMKNSGWIFAVFFQNAKNVNTP